MQIQVKKISDKIFFIDSNVCSVIRKLISKLIIPNSKYSQTLS